MTNGLKGFIVEMDVLALQLLLFLEVNTLLIWMSTIMGSLFDLDSRCFLLWGSDQIYLPLVGCLCNTKPVEEFLQLCDK